MILVASWDILNGEFYHLKWINIDMQKQKWVGSQNDNFCTQSQVFHGVFICGMSTKIDLG